VARGEHLKTVQESGLTVITETETFVAKPTLATDNVEEIGTADYVLLTTKSYDLDQTIEQLKPCNGKHTVILPLLNGVNITTRIRSLLPDTEVWNGCVYIVSRLKEPGVVESKGNIHLMFFGHDNKETERLLFIEKIMKEAEIDVSFSRNILSVIWRKFFFISSTASLTSYFNVSFGALLTDENRKNTLKKLLRELLEVAIAEKIEIDETVIEKTIQQLEKLPFETTSSMHSDFIAGRNTELQTLTGIVVELARRHGIPTPTYDLVYSELSIRK
jgi:2-dehydropantoate 2-reductase